jgi:hypothetical protein
MATATKASNVHEKKRSPAPVSDRRHVAYRQFIESQIRRTRRQVKLLDVACSLIALSAASLVYLVAVAVVDQWAVAGGLSTVGRSLAFAALLAGIAAFVSLRLVPLVMRRVNPVFAAQAIESNRPNLKNSLINFLLLRSSTASLSERVSVGMEVQAARALAAAPVEVDVDRSGVIRLLVLMVVIALGTAIYAVASPKSLFTSLRRIVEPWANVAAPTRVRILDVRPGEATASHEQRLPVSADIAGLTLGESVSLVYSTLDGQVVRRSTPMNLPEASYRYVAELPSEERGLQQDLEYWIEAGDAASPHYQVVVEPAPAIVIERVEYSYPRYTGHPPRVVGRSGDLQALDGTRVTLLAKANQPINKAEVDFDCDGHNDLAMKVEGQRATAEFPLTWNAAARQPEHTSYQLRFRSQARRENPEPIRYAIEVTPDLPPEITLAEPQFEPRQERTVSPRRALHIVVRAVDHDFGLASVTLHAQHDGLPLFDIPLLDKPRHGPFVGEHLLDLADWKLKPGDRIEMWASADDNRMPQANHAETPHYWLRLAANDKRADAKTSSGHEPRGSQEDDILQSADGSRSSEEQQARDDDHVEIKERQSADHLRSTAEQKSNERSENAASGQARTGEQQPTADRPQRLDPERDAGKALAKIQQFFQEEKQKPRGDKQGPAPEDPGEATPSPQSAQPEPQEHKAKPSATDKMSEGGPQAQNAEQSTAGKKEDGIQETYRQSAGNQGGDNSAGAAQQDKVGGRSSGGTQKDLQKPDTPKQSGGAGQQPQAKFQRGMKRHEGGQSGETEKPRQSGVDDRPGNKVEPHRGDDPMPDDLAQPSTSDASGERHQGENSHRRGGLSGAESSRHQPQKQMPDGVSGKGEERPKNEAASDRPQEMKAKLGDDMPKNADGLKAPKPGQGEDVYGSGDPNEKENATSKENFDDYKGGDPHTNDKGDAGAGEQGTNHQGSPPPGTAEPGEELKHVSQVRDKKQISPDGKKPDHEDEPDSPAKQGHVKQSDSKSNQKGDRQGGGKSGGGQRAENQGTGAAGQNTASSQGGGQSDQQGGGPTGTKGGDRTKSNQPTGGKPSGEQGSGSHRQAGKTRIGGADNAPSPPAADPTGHANDAPQQLRQDNPAQPQTPDAKQKRRPRSTEPPMGQAAPSQPPETPPAPSNQQTASAQSGRQAGGGNRNPSGGGVPGPDTPSPRGIGDTSEPGGDEANLAYARQVTDLVVDRLKDELAKGSVNPELLDRLSWTQDDVDRFVAQWERLKRLADESGPRGEAARQELDDALRGLALRPRGSSLLGGNKQRDDQRQLRQGRRTSPPPEYAEQWFEFNKARQTQR